MGVLRKIFKAAAKIIAGIFVFYLLLSLVIIPLIAPWIAGSQATKILKHPVRVRLIILNPFLLRLTVKGLNIQDADKQAMVGFDRFWADLSFISLLEKKYRVESIGLEGLKVNAALGKDGNINLLGLIPQDEIKPAAPKENPAQPQSVNPATEQKPGVSTASGTGALPLPLVVIDLITVKNGAIRFSDLSVEPNFTTSLNNINLQVTNLSTNPEAEAKISFQAKLDDKGVMSSEALVKPFASPLAFENVFKLNDYALGVLTPYVAKFVGHKVKSGKLDLSMDYRAADNRLKASHKVLVQSFDFGDKVESKDALNLPFGLALALLEDSRNRIDISLPVSGDMSKPDFHYFHLIGQVLRNFFFKLVTKPFAFLGSLVGSESGSEEFGYVRFAPGQAELSPAEKEKLSSIVKLLLERPKILLEIKGSYDPLVDWRAIKTDVFNNDFRILKEESKRPESWVYQELYQRRFGIRDLWRLTKSYRSKEGVYDEEKLNAEIKRQLIGEGNADKAALFALAEARAKVIYDFVIAAGFEVKRVSIGEAHECQASAGFVPLELALTVYDNSSAKN
ncbi:MAG: DUF748 domain-containing protein [Candidatus Omnitrophica bacterium]|nr:DUF748 domain-containing protein [Candidatus Omnitrophota bacterium]